MLVRSAVNRRHLTFDTFAENSFGMFLFSRRAMASLYHGFPHSAVDFCNSLHGKHWEVPAAHLSLAYRRTNDTAENSNAYV